MHTHTHIYSIATLTACIAYEREARTERGREVAGERESVFPGSIAYYEAAHIKTAAQHTGIVGRMSGTARHNEPANTQIMFTPIEMRDARWSK